MIDTDHDNEKARYRSCRDEIEPMFSEWDRVRHDDTLRGPFLERMAAVYAKHGFTPESYLRTMNQRRTPRS